MHASTYRAQDEYPLRRLQKSLASGCDKPLKVKINDNRSTMLSVRWEPDHTRVSLHRMFLEAPTNVMDALACYLKGSEQKLAPTIKQFIETHSQELDYSQKVDRSRLLTSGKFFDLQEIYDEINAHYFQNKLRLMITWFQQPKARNRSKINLGLYQDTLRLVKINQILDRRDVPRYFISFVVYHEMLHAVCKPQVDDQGTNHIHSKEFKQQEARFHAYAQAKEWLNKHRYNLFEEGM